jgi:chromosome segregation ATPase
VNYEKKISYEEIEKDLAEFNKVLKSMEESHVQLKKGLKSIAENVEFQATELQKREEELNQTLSICGEVVDKVARKGDLNARVDVSKLTGKYKQIGGDINLLISDLYAKIDESVFQFFKKFEKPAPSKVPPAKIK